MAEAISYYAAARCFNHAIRLAKAFGLDQDLMTYALQCGSAALTADCAAYFEERAELEKAVQLYQRAGDVARALELGFRVAHEQVRGGPRGAANERPRGRVCIPLPNA